MPSDCDELQGQAFDPEQDCLEDREVLGCWDSSGDVTGDMACLKRVADGQIFVFTSGSFARALASEPEFTDCAPTELSAVNRGRCED